jgi:hypothetical protein
MMMLEHFRDIDVRVALGVIIATGLTDAVYVMFTASVAARQRFSAASWSSGWYLLSSFAIISYTNNWAYVLFAAIGSWIGAFATITFLRRGDRGGPSTTLGMTKGGSG